MQALSLNLQTCAKGAMSLWDLPASYLEGPNIVQRYTLFEHAKLLQNHYTNACILSGLANGT